MRLSGLGACALILLCVPARAEDTPFGSAARASDAELAGMRGGFEVPGGVDVSLAVQMDAAVNGALVLRTVFRVDQGTPSLAVYAPPPGTAGPSWTAPATNASTNTASPPPVVVLVGQNGISTVQPASTVPTSISVSTTGNPAIGVAPPGWSALPVSVGGPAVQTAAGTIKLIPVAQGTQVQLAGMQLAVTQIVGQAFLNSVQNSANNRMIDTATTVNIDLRNTGATAAAIGAARVANIANQVALRLAH